MKLIPEYNNFGGISTEEAGKAMSEVLSKMQDDPYYQCMILPMMEARIRYDKSWGGKLFPYSPLDRLKCEILIIKICSFFCIGVSIVLLLLGTSLLTIT